MPSSALVKLLGRTIQAGEGVRPGTPVLGLTPFPERYNLRMQVDVSIVGAGLVGASWPARLRAPVFRLRLWKCPRRRARTRDWETRIYALSPGNMAFLDALGAGAAWTARESCPVRAMQIVGDDGSSRMEFSAYEAASTNSPGSLKRANCSVHFGNCWSARRTLALVCPARPASLELDENLAILRTDGGHVIEARLLVGADGANSWVRGEAGFESRQSPTEKRAWLRTSRARSHTAASPAVVPL